MDEFISFCVTAEVIVIIKNQYPGVWAEVPLKEICGGKARNAGTHNDEIIFLARVLFDLRAVSESAIFRPVGGLERSRILTSKSR
jgi:hypothetical protein